MSGYCWDVSYGLIRGGIYSSDWCGGQGEKLEGSTSGPIAALPWLLRVHTTGWQLHAGAVHADGERAFGKEEPGSNDEYA